MKAENFLYLAVLGIVVIGCTQRVDSMEMEKSAQENSDFEKMCTDAGYEWMFMKPTQNGKFIKDAEECWGCMVEGIEHICDKEKLMEYIPTK